MSAMTNRPVPTTILSVTQDVAFSLQDLPLESLRREFGLLFDRAARELPKTGLDHVDVMFERRLVCRRGDQTCDVPADWLADRDRLVQCVRAAFAFGDHSWRVARIRRRGTRRSPFPIIEPVDAQFPTGRVPVWHLAAYAGKCVA